MSVQTRIPTIELLCSDSVSGRINAEEIASVIFLATECNFLQLVHHCLRDESDTLNLQTMSARRTYAFASVIANQTIRGMAGAVPSVISYSTLITACANGGETGQALDVFKSMQAAGVVPDVISYSSFITACANAGETGQALDVFKSMQAAGVAPEVISYNSLITACAQMWARQRRRLTYSSPCKRLAWYPMAFLTAR